MSDWWLLPVLLMLMNILWYKKYKDKDGLFPTDYKWKKKSCKKVEQTLKDKYGKENI
jgi:hypothetical protein